MRTDGVAVVGVGSTAIVRRTDRSLLAIACEAAVAALGDAGIGPEDVDGYIGTPVAPNPSAAHADGVDEVSGALLQRTLGLAPVWSADLVAMSATAVVAAAQALRSGDCRYVLVVRVIGNPPGVYSATSNLDAAGAAQFGLPYGYGAAWARHALWWARYMHDHGATREDLFSVVGTGRRHAQLNPLAYWKGTELTLPQYLAAPWVCEPLSIFDCDIPVTGAVAFVMTTAALAGGHDHPAHLVGGVSNADPAGVFARAGVAPAEVDVAQLYDGFASFVPMWLERLGFAETGGAVPFMRDRGIGLDGALPVNTFGGSLGEGRLHGAGHVREAVLQATGRAGERQLPNVRHSLVLVGIPETATALLFSGDA